MAQNLSEVEKSKPRRRDTFAQIYRAVFHLSDFSSGNSEKTVTNGPLDMFYAHITGRRRTAETVAGVCVRNKFLYAEKPLSRCNRPENAVFSSARIFLSGFIWL